MAKICPKCQFPIQTRICIRPCMHYLCLECYSYNRHECAYCSIVACSARQLPDSEPLFSCDTECFKVFESEEALALHQAEHGRIKVQVRL